MIMQSTEDALTPFKREASKTYCLIIVHKNKKENWENFFDDEVTDKAVLKQLLSLSLRLLFYLPHYFHTSWSWPPEKIDIYKYINISRVAFRLSSYERQHLLSKGKLQLMHISKLWIISEGMRSISQQMRIGIPMAALPHVIWRPQTAS